MCALEDDTSGSFFGFQGHPANSAIGVCSHERLFERLIENITLMGPAQINVSAFMSYFPAHSPSQFIQAPRSEAGLVCVPQRRYEKGAGRSAAHNKGLVVFAIGGGSFIPVTAALEGNYSGLIGRDAKVLEEVAPSIMLRFEVRGSYVLGDKLMLNGCSGRVILPSASK